MGFYYPIPAGALVTCMGCDALLIGHFDERGGWRGCPTGEHEEIAGHSVFLVSTNRRTGERRSGADRRGNVAEVAASTVRMTVPSVPVRSQLPTFAPLAAGPRGAVYMAAPGASLRGQAGQMVKVFNCIAESAQGKTMAELKKELRLKQKSLESVLYRLKLQGLIQAYPMSVRG